MPLIDIAKPWKQNTVAIEVTSWRVFGAVCWSPSPREAPATLAAELASSGATEAIDAPRARAMRRAARALYVDRQDPPIRKLTRRAAKDHKWPVTGVTPFS